MWKNINKNLKYFYFLFILIASVGPLVIYNSNYFIILRIIIAAIMMLMYNIKISKNFLKLMIIWILFVFFCTLVTGTFRPTSISHFLELFIESYVLINMFGLKLFDTYIKFMVILAFISLVGWLMIIFSLDILVEIMKPLNIITIPGLETYNVIIFSIHHTVFWHSGFPRNTGFAWEPGPFSILIVLAIFFNNSLQRKTKVRDNIILVLTLLTTFSTTGYSVLFIFWLYHSLEKARRPQYFILIPIIICIFVFSFNKIDFLGDKILDSASREVYMKKRNTGEEVLTGRRLVGFPLVAQDLSHNPLIGKGLLDKAEYKHFGFVSSVYTNSTYTILSSMGLFGFFWWFYLLNKSSKRYKKIFGLNSNYCFLIMIFTASFGFNLHFWSIIICFVFFDYMYLDNKTIIELDER